MKDVRLATKIVKALFDQSIDTEISVTQEDGVKTRIELHDMGSGTPVGIIVGDTLEDALASLYGKFAAQVRDIKTGRVEPKLTDL